MAVDKPVNLLVEIFVLCCFFSIPVSAAEDAIRIGNTPQLFVDDYLIASMETLRRVDHQAMKLNGGEPIFTGGTTTSSNVSRRNSISIGLMRAT